MKDWDIHPTVLLIRHPRKSSMRRSRRWPTRATRMKFSSRRPMMFSPLKRLKKLAAVTVKANNLKSAPSQRMKLSSRLFSINKSMRFTEPKSMTSQELSILEITSLPSLSEAQVEDARLHLRQFISSCVNVVSRKLWLLLSISLCNRSTSHETRPCFNDASLQQQSDKQSSNSMISLLLCPRDKARHTVKRETRCWSNLKWRLVLKSSIGSPFTRILSEIR